MEKQNAKTAEEKSSKRKTIKRILLIAVLVVPVFLLIRFIFPTWTPKIPGSNSISELRSVTFTGGLAALRYHMLGNIRMSWKKTLRSFITTSAEAASLIGPARIIRM